MSGSLDRHLFVWDVDHPEKRLQVKDAHKGGYGPKPWFIRSGMNPLDRSVKSL